MTIIDHVKKHRDKYIIGGIALTAGLTVGYLVHPSAANQRAAVKQFIAWHSPTTINLEQTTTLVRRGHPGNIIKCVETGEIFASQNRAADALGVSRSALSKHLKGVTSSINGLTFESLGEAL